MNTVKQLILITLRITTIQLDYVTGAIKCEEVEIPPNLIRVLLIWELQILVHPIKRF